MSALSELASSKTPYPTYGLKTIRHMRGTNTTSAFPHGNLGNGQHVSAPSRQSTKKKETTYKFFLEKVDPILGDCITFLLLEQPVDVVMAMREFLLNWGKKGASPQLEKQKGESRPKKEMKLYLATSIGPIVAKIVNRVAAKLPDDVAAFMIQELSNISAEESLLPDAPADTSNGTCVNDMISSSSSKPNVTKEGLAAAPAAPSVKEKRTIQIAVLGIAGSGKTTIINSLQGKFDPKPKPTMGFRPLSMQLGEGATLRLCDLGGGKRIRDIWEQYYHDIHGFVYVVDGAESSEPDSETITMMEKTLQSPYLIGKPVLIMANKQDLPGSKPASHWKQQLQSIKAFKDVVFLADTNSFVPENIEELGHFKADPSIEAGIEQLCESILQDYDRIQKRVIRDSEEKAKEEARLRREQEKRVLRSKMASAFYSQLSAPIIESLMAEPDPSNVFDIDEGLAFIAAEIGEEVPSLPQIAMDIAGMVGYQRLALQIVGALKVPISKKKVPMSWEDIFTLIQELREELQLPPYSS